MSEEISTLAKMAFEKGDFIKAAEYYHQAANQASAADDVLTCAEMKNNCSVALLKAEDADGALQAVLGTDEIFAKAGDIHRQGLSLGNLGAAHQALGNIELAMSAYSLSSDCLAKSGDEEARSLVLKSLSALQVKTGNRLEALASMQIALGTQKSLSPKERLLKFLLDKPLRMIK